jgi:hypothetical protein
MNIDLNKILISSSQDYHIYNEKALYEKRFRKVGKFHAPGLAPVLDKSGAYHINIYGQPIYQERYLKTFGFYCGFAAVEDIKGAFHININGKRLYEQCYDWVGNYQGNICVVRDQGKFFHINNNGLPIYDVRYEYVGDFKDGIGVVYKYNLGTHINQHGEYIHNKWFKSLDIFHKDYARAQDSNGWFHVDKNGNELYSSRYKSVEPFYNGLALVETFDGQVIQIDDKNEVIHIISQNEPDLTNILSSEMVGFWKTFIYAAIAKLNILKYLPNTAEYIVKQLPLPKENIIRILRAGWEAGILELNEGIWCISSKGKHFNSQEMSASAIMWTKVAEQWSKLTNLLLEPITSFKSFKDKEDDLGYIELYQQALDGYAIKDFLEYFKTHSINHTQKIIAFGRSCLGILYHSLQGIDHFDVTLCVDRKYLLQHSLSNLKVKQVDDLDNLSIMYDNAYLIKYIHYFDDVQASKLLMKLFELGIKELNIFENILYLDKPYASMLDINMLVETGGKLRTLDDWKSLLEVSGYQMSNLIELRHGLVHIICVMKHKELC